MEYKKLNECWNGLKNYDLSGYSQISETYNPVTMNLSNWNDYVSSGANTLYGGAIKTSGDSGAGAVIGGHVRQNPMTSNAAIQGPISGYGYNPGLGWIN
jgi:hypothetical protein